MFRHADQLTKKGAVIRKQPELRKQNNIIKHKFTHQQRLLEEDQLLNKSYQKIKDRIDLLNMARKSVMALFKMETGNDYLAKRLHKIGYLQTS